jgi:uncharacterized protein YbbK (DUF523 family)
MDDHSRIVIGVSACLLGERVRYDGGHQRDLYITGQLARQFQLIPICPEVEIGLGVPRRSIRLVSSPRGVRVQVTHHAGEPRRDLTDDLALFARELAPHLSKLSGYVFKSGSPSCGLGDVQIYDEHGEPDSLGSGEFARTVKALCPWMPVTDERQLADPEQCHLFIEHVYALRRWQDRNQASGVRRQASGVRR